MFNALQYADALATAVASQRASPDGGESQRDALRALLDLAAQKSATIRFYDGALTVDDWPVPAVGDTTALLTGQLSLHGVLEVVIGRGAEASELLALVRGIAAPAGQARIKERLRDADSAHIMVILQRLGDALGQRRAPGVTQAFERAQVEDSAKAEWNKYLASSADQAHDRELDVAGRSESGAAEISWPEAAVPVDDPEAPAAAAMQAPPEAPEAPAAAETFAPEAPPATESTRRSRQTMARAVVGGHGRPSGPRGAALPSLGDEALADALTAVLEDPAGPRLLERLTSLGKLIEIALRENRLRDALRTLEIVIGLEAAADPEARRSYGVILDRTLKSGVALLLPSLTDPRLSSAAMIAVRRGREVAVELLVNMLATSESLPERRAYLTALRGIPKGIDRALRLLRDSRWLVVRNVAEAAGDLFLDAATPYLSALQSHEDARVRRAAIVALARIGSAATVEPLRNTLAGGTPETRALIASSISGAQAAALVGPIQQWMEAEKKQETVAEYCRALGRIGTADAIQALARTAEAGGMLIARRSQATRLAAVEGLRLAGAAARTSLEKLATDNDKAVREAAAKALATA
jgi:HEAT repeat protein